MKKKLLTIMALLCAFGSAQADDKTSWDFESLGNDITWGDSTTWASHKTGYHYYTGAINGEQLTTDGTTVISQTEGLYFSIEANSTNGNIRIFPQKLGLYGTKSTVTIKGVGVGKMITIDYEPARKSSATVSFTNATVYANGGATSRAKVFAIASPSEESETVDVTFGINSGIYIYSINISDNNTNFPEKVSIAINSYGRQTYCSAYPLDFSSAGVDAYIATSADASTATVTLTKVTTVPDSTGVILKTNGDTKKNDTITVPVNSVYEAVETNLLVAASSRTTVPASNSNDNGKFTYIYGYNKEASDIASTIGFYKCTSDYTLTGDATVIDSRAYLQTKVDLLSSSGAKFVTMDFGDGEATGISNVNKVDDDAYYTLSGVKVAQPRKGLYIKNGKKVIVK